MAEETTDFYFYGMASLLKGINMIAFLLEYGLRKFNIIQDNSSSQDISLMSTGKNKYPLEINDIPTPICLLSSG